MFIVEGPDGSGKTTLANKIAKGFNAKIFHAGGPPESREDILERIEFQFKQFGSILDRASLITEHVYGPVLRGRSVLEPDEYKRLIQRYVDRGWVLIYCRPSIEVLLRYVKEEMDRVIRDEGKSYKREVHFIRVRANMPSIVSMYDRRISEARNLGMGVFDYVRNQSPV